MTRHFLAHVLCPVDFSVHSRAALRCAATLARRQDAHLTVLVVNDPLLVSAAAAAAAYDRARLAADTKAELARFVKRALGADAPVTSTSIALGQPAEQIRKAVTRLGVDLVVMGTQGLSGAGKWMFGSTTERVLRHATVPVLVVPPPAARRGAVRRRDLERWPGARVLAPLELGSDALARARRVASWAQRLGSVPSFVHVVAPALMPPWLALGTERHEQERVAAANRSLDRIVRAVGAGAEGQVLKGDPVDQIVARAVGTGTGLIVLTLKRGAGLLGPRQGSITYRLLRARVAPVLAIPMAR
jgi:nucleotide-binding universal stress UspA family protein